MESRLQRVGTATQQDQHGAEDFSNEQAQPAEAGTPFPRERTYPVACPVTFAQVILRMTSRPFMLKLASRMPNPETLTETRLISRAQEFETPLASVRAS
jgi:hypothetical protein